MTVRATAATASTSSTASTASTASTDALQAAKRHHERALETQREPERRSEMAAELAAAPRFPTIMAAVLASDKNKAALTTRHDLEYDMDWQNESERQRELAAERKSLESACEAQEQCKLVQEDKIGRLNYASEMKNSESDLGIVGDLRSDSEEAASDLGSAATAENIINNRYYYCCCCCNALLDDNATLDSIDCDSEWIVQDARRPPGG